MKIKVLIILLVYAYTSVHAQEESAIYTITFTSNWSQETHPHPDGALPSNAHWSTLVGATHNEQVSFLAMGDLATPGIENIAESGSTSIFNNEVNSAISSGTTNAFIDLGDLDTELGQITGTIQVSATYPLLTLISMIAPSPDWIIAINSVPLRNDAEVWEEEISIDLYPYDAGTDSGEDYIASNLDTNPAQPITNIQGVVPFSFEKIGTITISLDAVLSTGALPDTPDSVLYPNPSSGLVTISLGASHGKASVYDITGKLLDKKAITSPLKQMDYTNLSAGVYMVVIETDSKKSVQKLIIQ